MRFRPCIDIHDGKVKQIVGSTLNDASQKKLVTNFETELSSSYFAELYKKDNLMGGHVIMLGQGNDDAAIEALRAYPGGLQIGGGITTENAARFLDEGASHVIVTSYVFKDGMVYWEHLDRIRNRIGRNRLVLDLSCKKTEGKYFVVTDRWQKFTGVEIGEPTFNRLSEYCDEFLIHAADVEGKRGGIDEELVELLSKSSSLPLTYAGGIRSIEDLERVRTLGRNEIDATVGSALDIFGGTLKYTEVVSWSISVAKKTSRGTFNDKKI